MNGPHHFKYKKRWYELAPGTEVRIDYRNIFGAGQEKNWVTGTVEDVLAVQFTVLIDDPEYGDQTVFRSFDDVGTTWEPIAYMEAP